MHNAEFLVSAPGVAEGCIKLKCYSADQSGLCKLFIEPANALLRVCGGAVRRPVAVRCTARW